MILPFICCKSKSSKAVEMNPFFQDFLSNVPNRRLPIDLSCGLPDETNFSSEFEKYKSFIPKSVDRIYGTVDGQNDHQNLVMFGYTGDDIYPVLFSFDNSGQIKDSLRLILRSCGGADETQIPHSFVSIDNSLTIRLTDSTRLIHYPGHRMKLNDVMPALSAIYPDSTFFPTGDYIVDSIRISRQVFKIDNEGRFLKQ